MCAFRNLEEIRESVGSPGTRDTIVKQHMGAGDWIRVLYKTVGTQPQSHLSATTFSKAQSVHPHNPLYIRNVQLHENIFASIISSWKIS